MPRGRPKKIKTEDGEEVKDDLKDIDEVLEDEIPREDLEVTTPKVEFDPSLPESKQRHLR